MKQPTKVDMALNKETKPMHLNYKTKTSYEHIRIFIQISVSKKQRFFVLSTYIGPWILKVWNYFSGIVFIFSFFKYAKLVTWPSRKFQSKP